MLADETKDISYGQERVGVIGFEPMTSALSELRSSQLSYTPECTRLMILSSGDLSVQPPLRRIIATFDTAQTVATLVSRIGCG